MQLLTIRRGLAVVVTGLVVFAGGLAICKATPLCSRRAAKQAETPRITPIPGNKIMIVTQEQRRVQHADEATFTNLVLNAQGPVLVDFYADWCGPCRKLAPLLEELAVEVPGATIVKVNVDHSPRLAATYGIDSIPNVKVFNGGEITAEEVGLMSKGQLRALLER